MTEWGKEFGYIVEVYERILKFVISEWSKYPKGQTNEVYGFEKVTKASLL